MGRWLDAPSSPITPLSALGPSSLRFRSFQTQWICHCIIGYILTSKRDNMDTPMMTSTASITVDSPAGISDSSPPFFPPSSASSISHANELFTLPLFPFIGLRVSTLQLDQMFALMQQWRCYDDVYLLCNNSPSVDSAPRLGVYFLSLTLSVCLSVTVLLQIASFLFLDGIEPFLAVSSPCGTLQNCFLRFLI